MTTKKEKVRRDYVTDKSPFKGVEDNNPTTPNVEVFNPEELFSGENSGGEQQNQAKELFNPKNPKIKSEFSSDEINILARLYPLSRVYYESRGIYMLRDALDEFVLMRMSKDRKSRTEFVDTNRENKESKLGGMFGSMFGGGGLK